MWYLCFKGEQVFKSKDWNSGLECWLQYLDQGIQASEWGVWAQVQNTSGLNLG